MAWLLEERNSGRKPERQPLIPFGKSFFHSAFSIFNWLFPKKRWLIMERPNFRFSLTMARRDGAFFGESSFVVLRSPPMRQFEFRILKKRLLVASKTFFFAGGKIGIVGLFSYFCCFQSIFRKLFFSFFL